MNGNGLMLVESSESLTTSPRNRPAQGLSPTTTQDSMRSSPSAKDGGASGTETVDTEGRSDNPDIDRILNLEGML